MVIHSLISPVVVKFTGRIAVYYPRYEHPKRLILGLSKLRFCFCCLWTKVHQIWHMCTGIVLVCNAILRINDVFLLSGGISDQVLKLSEIASKLFFCFGAAKFLGHIFPGCGALVSIRYSVACVKF